MLKCVGGGGPALERGADNDGGEAAPRREAGAVVMPGVRRGQAALAGTCVLLEVRAAVALGDGKAREGVLVLHPHPWLGGSADVPVVAEVMERAMEAGFAAAATFQQRGVGRSNGRSSLMGFGDDMRDTARVLSALAAGKVAWDGDDLAMPKVWHLVGYSWGACHVAASIEDALAQDCEATVRSVTLLGFPMLAGSGCGFLAPLVNTRRFLVRCVKACSEKRVPLHLLTPEFDEFTNAARMHKVAQEAPGGDNVRFHEYRQKTHFLFGRDAEEVAHDVVSRLVAL